MYKVRRYDCDTADMMAVSVGDVWVVFARRGGYFYSGSPKIVSDLGEIADDWCDVYDEYTEGCLLDMAAFWLVGGVQ